MKASPSKEDRELYRAFRRAIRTKIARDLAAEEAAADERRARVRKALRFAISDARSRGLCDEAWLFGSYVWGQPGERSDVDLIVERYIDPEAVASIVARATGTDVHVVRIEEAPPSLRERVLAEGERL